MPKKPTAVARLDKNMGTRAAPLAGLASYDSRNERFFRLGGFPWYAPDNRLFRRLPPAASFVPPNPAIDQLAGHTAGGQLRFRCNSRRVVVEVQLTGVAAMDHMPQTGSSGFDLYVAGGDLKWQFAGVSRFAVGSTAYCCELFNHSERRMRNFLLHFPLYNGVESLRLRLDEETVFEAPPAWRQPLPVILYGTSITQGGCASRPGMAYGNILSRRLNQPVINFGFSGNGRGEAAMAELIATLPPPAMYLLDYEANAESFENLTATLPEFIAVLRRRAPQVPIVVLSRLAFAGDHPLVAPAKAVVSRAVRLYCRDAQRRIVEQLRREGDRHLRFIDGGTLLGRRFDDCTVDGVHPNDLGFQRIAARLEKLLFTAAGAEPAEAKNSGGIFGK